MDTETRLDLLSSLILENGQRWGECAAPFQWEDAETVLGDGPPYHFLTRARGGSKTTDLAGIAIVFLLTLRERSTLDWLAADQDQGQLAISAIAGFAARTPLLAGRLDIQSSRVIARESASTLQVLAADAPSAWGRAPAVTFVDELAQWAATPGPRRLWEAVSTSAAKQSGSKMIVLTTAGDPGHWSYKVLQHAEKDPMWRVHQVAGPAPWMDEDKLAEQKRRLPESSYRRLFENEWCAPEDRLTNIDDLALCVTLDGPQPPRKGVRYLIGLDLGLKSDRTVAAICHRDETTVVLDRLQVWAGTRNNPVTLSEVQGWLHQASGLYNRARIVADPWQAMQLIQHLRGRGVHVTEHAFSQQSNGRIALSLYRLLRDHHLALPDDPDLLDELSNVQLRETSPGVYRLDHAEGQHDDRAIALALAAHYLTQERQPVDQAALSDAVGVTNRLFAGRSKWAAG